MALDVVLVMYSVVAARGLVRGTGLALLWHNPQIMRILGLVGLLLVLGCGFYIYQRSATSTLGDTSPQEQIDTVAIRQRLLTIGNTEKQYMATNGKYATLEQLSNDNLLPGGTKQRGYTFTAEVNGATGFTIIATPTDDDKKDWPTLEITESLNVTER
jgi:hypothetical protein